MVEGSYTRYFPALPYKGFQQEFQGLLKGQESFGMP